MTKVRLSDEDRERLGIQQEWIEGFSLAKFMVSDAESLEAAGYPPDEFLEELRGIPVTRDGQPVMEDDGKTTRLRYPFRAVRAGMWIAVRRAGIKVPFADFDFQMNAVEYQRDADEQAAAGKAPTAARASSRTARATGSRSSKSSASSRGRSARS